jgi:polyisoprenoid-binding protein YceI
MKMLNASKVAMSIATITLAAGAAQAEDWKLDTSHTDVSFKVRHLAISNVRGTFKKVTGNLDFDAKNPTKASVEILVDLSTVDTDEPKRDDHLRSPDFFDVSKYPEMKFVSKKVKKAGKGKLAVTGDLTLHGVTKEIVLDVEGPTQQIKDPWGNYRRGFTATAKLDRRDFGLTWSKTLETGGLVVGNDIYITIEAEFMRPSKGDA